MYTQKKMFFNFPKNSSSSLTLCPQRIQGGKSQIVTKEFLFPGTVLTSCRIMYFAANRAVWEDDLSTGKLYSRNPKSVTFWSNSPSQNLAENIGFMLN